MFFGLENIRNFPAETRFLINRTNIQVIYTYKDVFRSVESILKEFQNAGIPKNCGIAIKLKNQHVTVAGCLLLLGILNHDCYFCPIHNVQDIASHGIAASYVLTDDRNDIGISAATHITSLTLTAEEGEVHLLKLCDTRVPQNGKWCYCISTTGSTGQPKLVYVPYACIAANVRSLSSHFQITSKDVIFLAAPLTFDPFVIEFFMALHNGAALLLTSKAVRQAPTKLLDVLFPRNDDTQLGATVVQTTPSLFRSFGADAIREVIFDVKSTLRILMLGGEPFPTLKELKTWLPTRSIDTKIFNIYGITEISCWSLISEVDLRSFGADVEISLGHAIEADTQVQIVDESGAFLQGAGVGELLLGSSTRKCFIPHVDTNDTSPHSAKETLYRRTGDSVERTENDRLYYRGRLNNTIKRFGKRLSLDALSTKIEYILSKFACTKAVCLWTDTRKKLICCLAYRGSACKLEIARLLMSGGSLMAHERPDVIVHREDWPLNSHGKIDRRKLHDYIEAHHEPLRPLQIFHKFLKESLGVSGENHNETAAITKPSVKKRKSLWQTSFVAAGGTSYQALSLSLEIGEVLLKTDDQRKLLELLLQPHETLHSIGAFLENAPLNASTVENTKSTPRLSKQFHFCWRKDFGKCVDASPTVVHNRFVCVGSHSHTLRALHSSTGAEVMHLQLPDRIECAVAFRPGNEKLAFVGCYDGHLYAFDVLAGAIEWHVHVGGMIKAKPLWLEAEQCLVVACYGEAYNLWCLGLEHPHAKWRLKLGSRGIFATPIHSSVQRGVYVCSLDGLVACIEPKAGLTKWTQRLKSPIFATPALIRHDHFLVVAEVNGNLHICTALHGEIMHTFRADGNIFSSIAVYATKPDWEECALIFGCHDHSVYCLQFTQSNQLVRTWRTRVNGAVYATPLVVQLNGETSIVAISTKGQLTLMDVATGNVTASYELAGEVFSTPCYSVRDERLYFGCRDNFLYCFRVG